MTWPTSWSSRIRDRRSTIGAREVAAPISARMGWFGRGSSGAAEVTPARRGQHRHIFSPGRLLAVQSTTRAGPRPDRRPRGCRGSAPRRASTPSGARGRGTCLEELQLYVLRVATERQEPAVALVAVERLIPLHGLVHVGHHAHDEFIKAFPNVPLPAGHGSDVDLHRSDGGKATSLRDR
jgi:hypothetical protein